MRLKFWKKIKKEYKRPNYYPTCRINYIKKINEDNEVILNNDSVNYCCDTFKEYSDLPIEYPYGYYDSDVLFDFSDHNNSIPFLFIKKDAEHVREKIWYCPFCGAKIELNCIKTLKQVKTGCDEIVEPEKIIPAKTKKVCKFEWQEV